MKYLKYILLCLSLFFTSNTFALEQQYRDSVMQTIAAFRSFDKVAISSHIRYPLSREYPVPAITNEAELVERFDQVFDQQLIAQIASSDINTDWEKVGWRGIMLNSGLVWVDLEGKIIGVNYQTEKEKQLANDLIMADKSLLHSSINTFVKPILDWHTANYHIRVDDIGDTNFRYTAWSVDKKPSDKPDLVLYNGEVKYEGSGGNHSYTFKNGFYRYKLHITVLGCETSSPGWIEVYKGGKLLLSQNVLKTINKHVK